MCLNHGRPGMPSGLSQLRSTCIMPRLRAAASLGIDLAGGEFSAQGFVEFFSGGFEGVDLFFHSAEIEMTHVFAS